MASNIKKWAAEFIGTFWLTFGGCGSAVLAAAFPNVGIGLLGVSFAFGLTVLTGAYALGPISGGHFNPAVSVGLMVGGRFKASELPGYIIAQVLGAIAAGAVLYVIATGKPGADIGGFATNGFAEHSPGGYSMMAALVAEVVLTAIFVIVILGATAKRAAGGFAGVAIGLLTSTAPVATALVTAVVAAVVIEITRSRGGPSSDLALALMFYGGIAAGVVLIGLSPQGTPANLTSYLFGSITATTTTDLYVFLALAIAVVVTTILLRPWLFAVAQDEEYARASGLPVTGINILLSVLTAVTVVEAAARV